MSKLAAAEAETIFNTMFSFLWGHLGNTYDINIHGVGVFSRFRWRGGMVVGLFGGVVPTGSGSEQLLHTKQ